MCSLGRDHILLASRLGPALDLLDTLPSKEQAQTTTRDQIPSVASTSGRISTKGIQDFKISINEQHLSNENPLCLLNIEAARNETMSLPNNSGTSQILGGVVAGALATPLDVILAPHEEVDWKDDFLSAADPFSSARTEPLSGLSGMDTALNTPTMELPGFNFRPVTTTNLNKPATTTFAGPAPKETILAEMDVDVAPPSTSKMVNNSGEFAPTNNIENIWNLGLDTPDTDFGFSLHEVEGNVDADFGFNSAQEFNLPDPTSNDALNPFIYSDPLAILPIEATMPPMEAVRTAPERSVPTVAVKSLKESAPPTTAAPQPDTLVAGEVQEKDLLNWILSETFNEDSPIPGEFKNEIKQEPDNMPTTLTTIDTSELFSGDNTNSSPLLSSPSAVYIETRTGEPRNKRVRNESVASSYNSSVEDAPPKRRGRGRPPRAPGRRITPPVVGGRIVSGGEDSDYPTDVQLTDSEMTELRYRRMRDLNNEASKRCREKRKQKFNEMEKELHMQIQRNTLLQTKLKRIEATLMKVKSYYLTNLVPGQGARPDISQLWCNQEG